MAILRTRVSGAWVDSNKSGAVRLGGSTISFGPSSPTTETIVWPLEPTSTDNADGTQSYNMGIKFTLTTAKDAVGVRWRVPDTVETPGGLDGHVAAIWNDTTETRLAFKPFTPVPGGYQDIMFDSPISLVSGQTYIATIYAIHYVYRSSTDPVTSTSGVLTVQGGKLAPFNGGSLVYPDSNSGLWFYVAPIIQL